MTIDLPPRYTNKDGKMESPASYETFYKTYIKYEKNLTYKELAELTGYKPNTCKDWITKFDYIERKNKIILEQEEKQKQKKQSLLDIVGDTIEQQIKLNTLTDNGFMMKTKNTMQQYSHDNHLQLEDLDVTSETYKSLHYAQREDKKRPLQTIETIKEFYNLQTEVVEQHEEQVVLEEAMELAENARFDENIQAVEKLQEDMKDEEY